MEELRLRDFGRLLWAGFLAFISPSNCLINLFSSALIKSISLLQMSSDIGNLRFSLEGSKIEQRGPWRDCLIEARNFENKIADWKLDGARSGVLGIGLVIVAWYGDGKSRGALISVKALNVLSTAETVFSWCCFSDGTVSKILFPLKKFEKTSNNSLNIPSKSMARSNLFKSSPKNSLSIYSLPI